MPYNSKPITKTDDESKKFIIECLKGDETKGFDIDSIYYADNTWYVFEYLKCESASVTPHTSNPKYYPYNWKKFYSLYCVAKALNGKLILVNYSTRAQDSDEVKIMEVLDFDYKKAVEYKKEIKTPYEYMTLKEQKMTKDEFSNYLRSLNARGTMLPFKTKASR